MPTSELYFIGQIAFALLLGAILGWERERIGKPAGLRTYALVSAGSAIFTIISGNAFGGSEPTRVAAQIVSGIEFIGAGAILHHGDHTEGVTTAAGLWVAAALGMAIGVEMYWLAGVSTILFTVVLLVDEKKKISKKILQTK